MSVRKNEFDIVTERQQCCYLELLYKCLATNSRHLSQYSTNLMHKICFKISFISCLYMFRAHVLIIKRSKLYYTAVRPSIGVMIPEAV